MGKLNLLLLEDEQADAFLIQRTLERAGMEFGLQIAIDKKEFLNAILTDLFDVVLADNSIPQFDAIAALSLMKEKKINVPFILVTGSVSEEFAVSAMKCGAEDYILKDRLQRLPSAVLSVVEKHKLEEDRKQVLEAAVAKEALMNAAEKLAHFGSFSADMVANTSNWSDEKFRILGYEPGAIQPSFENFIARVHPADAAQVISSHEHAFQHLDKLAYDCRISCPDGVIKHIHGEVAITRDENKALKKLNGFIWDVTESKEAELKIQDSEKKYRHLFENNPFPLWVMDIDATRILDVNKAATLKYGYSRDEFLSMTAYDLRPESEAERFRKTDIAATFTFSNKGIWKHRKKDGGILYVEVCANEIIFEDETANLVLINDVTEKVIADHKLKTSEAQLVASQRIGHIGAWELDLYNLDDLGSNELRWTDETFSIFGFEPGEVDVTCGLFLQMVHPADVNNVVAAINDAVENKQQYSIEHRVIWKNGTERIVHELGEIVFDEETRLPIKLSGTTQDITDRRNAEDMLLKSEANLRTIFDNTDTGYVLLDADLNIVSYNKPIEKFCFEQFGTRIKEGTYAVNYFNEDRQEDIKRSLDIAIKGTSPSYEVCLRQADGYDKWFHAGYHPVWHTDKKILGVIMTIADITERKISELQEKKITADLLQRNKDLEQFAYIISHNLRAPVANIISVSDMLMDGSLTVDETAEFMEAMNMSVKKLDGVIIDLNEILQVKHKLNENKEKVSFSQIVNDIKYSISNYIADEYVEIRSDFSEIDEMSTMKSYLHSIFYNLISNSIKYRQTDVTPVIEIRSKKCADTIEILFKDNSMGIDMEKRGEQVFGLYKRFHPHLAEGKGIGLFMVKTQVETLGGKISLRSEVNKGSEFRIVFDRLELAN